MLDSSLLELWPAIVGGGFMVGFLVGMTGVGAGSLMTPFLITQIGVPPALAVGTDLLFASLTKASAALPHHKLGNVDWRIVRWLAAGSIPGAAAMLAALTFFEPNTDYLAHLIKQTLVAALVLSSSAILVYPYIVRKDTSRNKDQSDDPAGVPVRWLSTLLLGVVLGSLVTLTSVGAGAIGVVILTLIYPRLMTRRLIGTDIVHAVPLTLVSGLGHLSVGNVNFMLLGLLLAGSLPGIALGSRLTGRLPDSVLRIALSAILLFAAYQLFKKI